MRPWVVVLLAIGAIVITIMSPPSRPYFVRGCPAVEDPTDPCMGSGDRWMFLGVPVGWVLPIIGGSLVVGAVASAATAVWSLQSPRAASRVVVVGLLVTVVTFAIVIGLAAKMYRSILY